MSDTDNIEIPDAQESMESAAFKKAGYNRTVFKIKSFITETVGGAMKGAMIGVAILAGGAIVGGLLLGGGVGAGVALIAPWLPFGLGEAAVAGATKTLMLLAMTGAGYGAALGGLFKGGSAVSNLDEMADDEEQRLVLKYQQAQQRDINHKQMQLNQEIAKANAKMGAQGMGMSPQMTPQGTIVQNQGFGMGKGGIG